MSLENIRTEILGIATDMGYGNITYSKKKSKAAIQHGKPEDFLREITIAFWAKIKSNRTPENEKENIEAFLPILREFKKEFKVKELSKPIKELTDYLSSL